MRADLLLVQLGLAKTRSRAQDMITRGEVSVCRDGKKTVVAKAGLDLDPSSQIEVASSHANQYVSRGGMKLAGALGHTGLQVQGLHALDIGISTGGFTDCLLRAGARSVVGVDVGHGQLAESLLKDPRVRHFEGINARDLRLPPDASREFDLVVIDVSFISLTLVLSQGIQYLLESGFCLALVKPQFEVGRAGVGKDGLVKDVNLYALVEDKIRVAADSAGFEVMDYFASSIEGTDGNKEFFLFARPRADRCRRTDFSPGSL